jgi:hypothetical protein
MVVSPTVSGLNRTGATIAPVTSRSSWMRATSVPHKLASPVGTMSRIPAQAQDKAAGWAPITVDVADHGQPRRIVAA